MTQNFHKFPALDPIAAALLGAVAFLSWAGPRLLDPTNVGWLRFNDRAIHTLGWWYFRNSPWGLPLGINPRNGLEISTSVGLSDSLPLFALPFKLLAPVLPATFQYWGIWLLLSMVLQAVFGWALAREMRLSRVASLIFAAFVLLTPSLLLQQQLHMALAGHWVILAALYLYVRQVPPPRYLWPLLLAVTAAIHVYLLAMVLAIWVASLLQRGLLRSAIELVLGAAATLLVLWAAGFMMISSFGAGGFGYYRTNLLSFFDPQGFSRLLPPLPDNLGDYEGLAFPGLGALILLAIAVIVAMPLLRRIFTERWMPLLLVVLALTAFAITNQPVIGQLELGTLPLPAALLRFAALFRAAGRMIWPAAYLLVLTVFVMLDRRLGQKSLAALAGIALLIQIADISGGWQNFARETSPIAHDWPSPMQSAFWDAAPQHYSKLRAIPASALNSDWVSLSHYASLHDMGSDAADLGRSDFAAFSRLAEKARSAVEDGNFEPDALYVLDLPSAILARRFAKPEDLLGNVDKYFVFARGGASLAGNAVAPLPDLPVLAVGQTVAFEKNADNGLLYLPESYWMVAEDWGTPMWPPTANIGFRLPDAGPHILHLLLAGHSNGGETTSTSVQIEVGGKPAQTAAVPTGKPVAVDVDIPSDTIDGNAIIGLHIEVPQGGAQIVGALPDVGVVSMTLESTKP